MDNYDIASHGYTMPNRVGRSVAKTALALAFGVGLVSPAAAYSKATMYLIGEEIAEACEGRGGKIKAEGIFEVDLNGDGGKDLILSHQAIVCAGQRSTSTQCGTQACTIKTYMRDEGLLRFTSEFHGRIMDFSWAPEPSFTIMSHGGEMTEWRPGTQPGVNFVQQDEPAKPDLPASGGWAEIQTALKLLGFSVGEVDGEPGPVTRSAIGTWQAALGAEATGVLSADQRTILLQIYRAGGVTAKKPANTQLVAGSGGPNPVLDQQFLEAASDGTNPSCQAGVIKGLKTGPKHDGFLSVRTGPNENYRKINQLHNGDEVVIFARQGRWLGVAYRTPGITCLSTVDRPVPYKQVGWIHSAWVKPIPFVPASQPVATVEPLANNTGQQQVAGFGTPRTVVDETVSAQTGNVAAKATITDGEAVEIASGGASVNDDQGEGRVAATSPVTNHIFPAHRFALLNGHAVYNENRTTYEDASAWKAWLHANLPLYAPDYATKTDHNAYMVAYVLLSPAEKRALQTASGMDFKLFLDESDYQVTEQTVRAEKQHAGKARRHVEKMLTSELNEFTKPVVTEQIRQAVRAKVTSVEPQRGLPVVRIYESTLGEYDLANEVFALNEVRGGSNTTVGSTEYTSLSNALKDYSTYKSHVSVAIKADAKEFPLSVPMAKAEAQSLLEEYATQKDGRFRKVRVAVYSVIDDAELAEHKGRDVLTLKTRVSRIDIATDDQMQNVIYSYVPEKLSQDDLDQIAGMAGNGKKTLFDMEYLAAAMTGVLPGMVDDENMQQSLFEYRTILERTDLSEFGLDPAIISRVIRPEVLTGVRKPTVDDLNKYRALLAGQAAGGAASVIHVPVALEVNEDETGNKRFEHGLIGTTLDMLGMVITDASLVTGNRWGADFRQTPRYLAATVPAREGYEILPAGYVPDGQGGQLPVYFHLRTHDGLYDPLTVARQLRTPASGNQGAPSNPYMHGNVNNTIKGHLVLRVSESARLIELNDNAAGSDRGVVITVEPEKLSLMDMGEPVDVAVKPRAGGDSVASKVEAPAELSLDAETSDLLMIKFMPEKVGDNDYKRMMQARWQVENDHQKSGETPVWGRFFRRNQPKPDPAQLDRLVEDFRAWSVARAAALPETFKLRQYTSLAANPGIHGFGGTFNNPNTVNSVVHNCEYRVEIARNSADYRPNQVKMLENACAYNKAAAQLPSNVQYGSDRTEYLTKDFRQRMPNMALESALGARSTCRTFVRGNDSYCRYMTRGFKQGEFDRSKFVLDDIYVFDKVLDVSQAISAQARQRDAELLLTARVKNVERSDEPRLSPLEQAIIATDELLRSQGLAQRNSKPARETMVPEIVDLNHVHLDLVSAELVNGKTGETIATVPLVEAPAMPDAALLRPVEKQAVETPAEPYGPDMIGLRLGMSFDQADEIIRAHMDVGRVLHNVRDLSFFEATGEFAPYKSARAYESSDGKEVIIIYDEPPAAEGIIVGAVRQLVFAKGSIAANQIFPKLAGKYGKPQSVEGFKQTWGEGYTDGFNCGAWEGSEQRRINWRDENGGSVDWNPGSFRTATGIYPPTPTNIERSSLEYQRKCGAGLTALIESRSNDNWDRLVFRLHDRNTYFELLRASEDMVQDGTPISEQAAQQQTEIELKL